VEYFKPIEGIVQTLGLPACFCIWLMWQVQKRLDEQTAVLNKIAESMSAVLEHVREDS
jgi:hypothetical protein